MSPQEINEKIALRIGWKKEHGIKIERWYPPSSLDFRRVPPNFYADLNACHEMRKALNTHALKDSFVRHLCVLRGLRMPFESTELCIWFFIIDEDASRQCEAFLKTFGDWKD